jgi:uncharacterized membrane protein
MKLFGHPIHPLFIHFPTALLPMDLALSILSNVRGDASFATAGFYCLAAGALTGFAAMLTGLLDLLQIPKENKAAWASGLYHGFVNGCIMLIFAVIAWRAWQQYPQLGPATTGVILVKSILILALFAGNYIGGKLIYQYHIGIQPKATAHGNETA